MHLFQDDNAAGEHDGLHDDEEVHPEAVGVQPIISKVGTGSCWGSTNH